MKTFIRKLLHPKIGKKIYCYKGDYEGEIGTIEWCDKCCHSYRVQFDEIGNNERLSNMEGKITIID